MFFCIHYMNYTSMFFFFLLCFLRFVWRLDILRTCTHVLLFFVFLLSSFVNNLPSISPFEDFFICVWKIISLPFSISIHFYNAQIIYFRFIFFFCTFFGETVERTEDKLPSLSTEDSSPSLLSSENDVSSLFCFLRLAINFCLWN